MESIDVNEKILIVEDEHAISQVLKAYFKKADYEVILCNHGDEAIKMITKETPDLILLDVMLPGRDGWSILEEVRSENLAPVIMLTALGDVPERLKGLNLGADDYIAKPFVGEEVVARAKAVLRRLHREHPVQRYGDLAIDRAAHQVLLFDQPLALTPKDISVLIFLSHHQNQTFTREQLIEEVWGWDYEGSDRAVDLSIKRLRKALKSWPNDQGEILTVRGIGYQFHTK